MNEKAIGCSTPASKLLQFKLLKYALEEHNINLEELNPVVDHRNGVIIIKSIVLDLKYPKLYLENISRLNQDKIYDFCFIGHYESHGRKESLEPFICKNSFIKHSVVGRNEEKYNFDSKYYQVICNSKFSLVPNHIKKGKNNSPNKKWHHPNAWSYRFIESIISNSVPILFRESSLGSKAIEGFKFLWNDSNFDISDDEYNSIILHNYKKALDKFFITKDEIYQINLQYKLHT